MIINNLAGNSRMNLIQIIARYFFHLILAGSLVTVANIAVADLANGFDNALSAAERSAEDRERDAARKPKQVLEFLGIGAGMTVLDVAAGAGWYTEVLSAAVGDDGHVISQNS
jgi:predicted methyltransferase